MPLRLADLLSGKRLEPRWLIDRLIHKRQFVVAAGEAGVGKSFFWYTAAFAIVLERTFLGRQCAGGRVLYFDDENSLPELQNYLIQIWWAFGCPNPEMVAASLFIEHFKLSAAGDSWPAYMSARIADVKPALVVVDTATTALGVADENDNAEAGRIVRQLRRCMSQGHEDGSLLAVKHAKDGTVRGAKGWEGMCDQLLVQANMVGPRRADGYHNSKIWAKKLRSFGLRECLKIIPVNGGTSLSLKSEVLEVKLRQQVNKHD